MPKNKDVPKDPIEKLNKLLDKHYPGALKNKIKTEETDKNLIIEINDLEISLALELFKKAQEKFRNLYIFELEERVVFPKNDLEEVLRFMRSTLKQSAAPKPTILHAFTEDRQTEVKERQPNFVTEQDRVLGLEQSKIQEREAQENEQKSRTEDLRILNEYSNAPREQLHTEPERTPQRIAKEITKGLKSLENSLDNYIKEELKNPSHGHLGGFVGSDQFVKKGIAENILGKLENFNKMEITDPDYQKTKRDLKRDLHQAIEANRKAHGFWASLGGPGRLENILVTAEETLKLDEPKSKRRHT